MNSQHNILGIHHVTAIAGDAQKNLDFYTGILGLRMVKKTVNFDDPYTYHLYYGDEIGHPGTLLTFFPWSSQAHRGRKGTGQLSVYSFSIPREAVSFWIDRLKRLKIDYSGPVNRFGEEVISAADHDGFQFELIGSSGNASLAWENTAIPAKAAIRGFHGVTLFETGHQATTEMLTSSLGFKVSQESGNRVRLETGEGGSGTVIDIVSQADVIAGSMGVGIVHHVAWRTPNDATQLEVRDTLVRNGLSVTPVIDRNYFNSIYFNEPGGVIFEVATDPPGFLIDEPKETLGASLKLPKQYEPHRADIERSLPPVTIPVVR